MNKYTDYIERFAKQPEVDRAFAEASLIMSNLIAKGDTINAHVISEQLKRINNRRMAMLVAGLLLSMLSGYGIYVAIAPSSWLSWAAYLTSSVISSQIIAIATQRGVNEYTLRAMNREFDGDIATLEAVLSE